MTASITNTTGIPIRGAVAGNHTGIGAWFRRHAASLTWLLPVVAVTVIVQAWNMSGTPQRIDDEGTYTAQAWAIMHLGEITHYTYWYDHPPLGWIQIAGYTGLTGAFARYPFAVEAGREAMVFFSAVSSILLFVLARRLGAGRITAAAAGLVFALSPLALQYHRTVYIDNVATPWLLAAFVLVLSRRQQLAGFAGAAACLGIAVLSKETYLLALPFLIWMAIRRADKSTRRYTLSVAGAVLVVIGGGYLLLAAVKGELLPSSGRVSLFEGITYQLGSRSASGSLFDPGSLANAAASQWWALDPVFIVLGSAAAVVGLFLRRVRPIAAMLVFLLAMMFRPNGYLPVPYVIMLIPFAALLVAYTAERAVLAIAGRVRTRTRLGAGTRRGLGITWAVTTAVALVVAVPLWGTQLRGFVLGNLDLPMQQAEQWVGDNVSKSSRLLVDDAMWVDLVEDGFARNNVVWYYKLDTDGAVERQSPNGWKDSDYVITTDSMRTGGNSSSDIRQAIENSTAVATFGSGDQQVEVRRIHAEGSTAAQTAITRASDLRKTMGTELASNPALRADDGTKSQFRAGQVDSRAMIALGQVLADQDVRVDRFTPLTGETGQPFRTAVLHTSDAASAERVAATLEAMPDSFRPASVEREGERLTVTYTPADPTTTATSAS
ncbi:MULTISPECIES: glycosyltransferase family 39 protein [unclassified Curtobacterium]|uniref:ArnT family glycosyltransferase n=1 Tax=unclassified Curtobacterium TaxID=257496 RepID=UPI000F4A4128|nr:MULTISPECIES: glycosyltransferase family 39 protein [unclassified Curtobacterium]ROQ03956.1 4-amino-4-deoxy-L-arabinose transferase-like glycosyltransferase [Curtobacterium sp. PhB171]ROQ19221.1 4-amino-4-deoxy-L-arabinose transferase-like glycosyltransferase [Curtobacterium sp. PhB170]ROS32877.1 4-amino-4-deoxy-L-arabinose transferase-like glycosyltransferase [Curtobacterium sp. PhB131]ROS64440.1 4-amino-4-deoxy-L-arabinose transferase-like glycosyltransferase [Curtobacterium sp. PhB141]